MSDRLRSLVREVFGDTFTDLLKQWRRELIGALVALLLPLLLGLIAAIADREHLTWSEVPGVLLSAYPQILRALAEGFRTNPIFASLVFLLVPLYAIVIAIMLRARQRLRSLKAERDLDANTISLARQTGIGGRWPHAATDGSGAPWKDLQDEICRPQNNLLCILGANGLETFGQRGAPLYDCLSKFQHSIRIILLQPGAESTHGRAAAVGMPTTEYDAAITTSVHRMRSLRQQGRAIDGRFYDGLPNWKLIITNRTLWIQYYRLTGHVHDTPVYRLDVTADGTGLYHLFCMEFERVWRRCENAPMKLS